MAALEANKPVKAAFDPCEETCDPGSSAGLPPDDFPLGARRPETSPYREPEQPPKTLSERVEGIEKRVALVYGLLREANAVSRASHRNIEWLTEHWHRAIDRTNEQLGDGARRPWFSNASGVALCVAMLLQLTLLLGFTRGCF